MVTGFSPAADQGLGSKGNKELMPAESDGDTIELVGGQLCLDFANTVGNHKGADPHEHLGSYSALLAWGRHAGVLTDENARQLAASASRHPEEAQRVYVRSIALREALYRIFSCVSTQIALRPADLAILNKVLSGAMSHARIVKREDGFQWGWQTGDRPLDQILWPIARSAADLLTSSDLALVRECDNETCGWLFVDTSKNHSRRWCSMSDCGNRAKARRHYARLKRN